MRGHKSIPSEKNPVYLTDLRFHFPAACFFLKLYTNVFFETLGIRYRQETIIFRTLKIQWHFWSRKPYLYNVWEKNYLSMYIHMYIYIHIHKSIYVQHMYQYLSWFCSWFSVINWFLWFLLPGQSLPGFRGVSPWQLVCLQKPSEPHSRVLAMRRSLAPFDIQMTYRCFPYDFVTSTKNCCDSSDLLDTAWLL